jgi:cytochrome c-type biogenesis protein CcmH/NrfF
MQVSTCFCGTADSIREDIAAKLDAGWTAERIVAAYVEEHGTWGLAVPPKEGFNLVVWVLPGFLLASGAVLVFALARRWTRDPSRMAPVAAAEGQAGAAGEERLRDELERLLQDQD